MEKSISMVSIVLENAKIICKVTGAVQYKGNNVKPIK